MNFVSLIPSKYKSKAKATLVLLVCIVLFGGTWGSKNITTGHLVAILVGGYLIWEMNNYDSTQSDHFNVEMESRLQKLDPKSRYPYLVTDLDLLYLLYLSLPLQINNEKTFEELMQATNTYLESLSIIGCNATEDPTKEFESLVARRDLICNLYHTLVYQLDDNSNIKDLLYQRCLDKIRVHLNAQLQSIQKTVTKKQNEAKVSIRTIFLPKLHRPRPLDYNRDSSLVERNFHFF